MELLPTKNYSLKKNRIWQERFPYLINDLKRIQELERACKIPGVKFLMKYVYPIYKKIKLLNSRLHKVE